MLNYNSVPLNEVLSSDFSDTKIGEYWK